MVSILNGSWRYRSKFYRDPKRSAGRPVAGRMQAIVGSASAPVGESRALMGHLGSPSGSPALPLADDDEIGLYTDGIWRSPAAATDPASDQDDDDPVAVTAADRSQPSWSDTHAYDETAS